RKTLSKHCEELSLENAVIFHGAKFEDEKLNLLAHMDVFIHTSRWEGLPT
ncbi:MAG: glycosyltransferase, partial [Aliifodinibius sp.]|nr:glycosyltransferase family 4 protein [Candidatus Saccharibacteria bacterium]NIV14559.1 glycosyltransferase [Fodinibius sp.]